MCKITMPSCYNILSSDEMLYLEGGATQVQAFCAWFVPFYGWYKGITAVRDTAMQTQKIGYYPALRLYAMTWKKALLIRIMTLGVWLMFLFLLLRESGFW